jgi:hypothetical protein
MQWRISLLNKNCINWDTCFAKQSRVAHYIAEIEITKKWNENEKSSSLPTVG